MAITRSLGRGSSVSRFVLVAFILTVTGLACATFAGLAVGFVLRDRLFGFGALAGAIGGMMIGYPLGAILGPLLVRRSSRVNGSLLPGVLGCLVGAGLTMFIAGPLNLTLEPSVLFTVYFVSVPVLGSVGFLSRGAPREQSASTTPPSRENQ